MQNMPANKGMPVQAMQLTISQQLVESSTQVLLQTQPQISFGDRREATACAID
jgi:hypothetical protein